MKTLDEIVLNNKEFVDVISDHQVNLTKELIQIADKYELDRNKLFEHYVCILMVYGNLTDLKEFEVD